MNPIYANEMAMYSADLVFSMLWYFNAFLQNRFMNVMY